VNGGSHHGDTDDGQGRRDRQGRKSKRPLESLDWVVDAKGQRLIGNPDYDGEWGVDAF
jgi:hypothetical protein